MEYRMCNNCIMDTTAEEITFDSKGNCNFCNQASKSWNIVLESIKNNDLQSILPNIVNKKSKYDCLIGLSGGVDSSYLLYKAIELGLRPLCFSIDNGWNDPKADENIMRLVETLKVPFYRYTIDNKKFLELQNTFMKAGVPNLEIPTDHILMASSYELASKYRIKYILSGGNVATESIMPASWGHNARDLYHIRYIYNKFTGKKLRGLPLCSLLKWNWYRWVKGIKIVYLLDYIEYNRQNAIKILEDKFGYKPYGAKHEESIFTTWFQNFYLYEKFGFDKRKPHLSSLIVSGQITRKEALDELEKNPIYPELGIEKRILAYPRVRHEAYGIDKWYGRISRIVKFFKKI